MTAVCQRWRGDRAWPAGEPIRTSDYDSQAKRFVIEICQRMSPEGGVAVGRLFEDGNPWEHVVGSDAAALALVDGTHPACEGKPHYSRRKSSVGSATFTPNGPDLVLVTSCGRAVWAVCENKVNKSAEVQFRCTVFRNEGAGKSSDLIRHAVDATYRGWRNRYHREPLAPLTTEVDPAKVRHKRDPGRCFLKAGWQFIGETKSGLYRFQAPDHPSHPTPGGR